MQKQDELNDLGYRFHCCDILLAEIKLEMETYKDQKVIRDMLIADTKELATKVKKFKGMFLTYPYWI